MPRLRRPAPTFVSAPGGAVFDLSGTENAELAEERLRRWIPAHALAFIERGNYWVVTEQYSGTARTVLLLTSGRLVRLWAESYPAALARLERRRQAEAASGEPCRGAA